MMHAKSNRSKLLMGCGSMALALAMMANPEEARAQAFQGFEEPAAGSVTRIFTGTGTETIVVETDTAVLDWTPFEDTGGNALDFLPTNNVATFENGVNVQNFAILNRILPSTNGDVVVFDGTVISVLVDALGARSPGGTVAFYSPTGILVGPNAAFDVGNLILTTLDPDLASFDNFALNGGTLIQSSPGSTASIIISPGANIAATPENSYFAVTAAEIQMFGTSNVNGSQAYVAGETVNITISNGLFDIDIPLGTSVGTPIIMDGNVGGPSSTGVGDNHLIYAVAAAQNDPISLLFSGNLGFAPAAAAGIVNGEIILSANYEVAGRGVDFVTVDGTTADRFSGLTAVTGTLGSIFVEDFAASSTLMAVANDSVQISALLGPSSVSGNLFAFANNLASVSALNGQTFDISGFASVGSTRDGASGANVVPGETNGKGGVASLGASEGGVLTIGGDVRLRANAQSGQNTATATSGTATGGTAELFALGGTVSIGGAVDIFANGFAGIQTVNQIVGADHTGGIAEIIATLDGSVTVDGNVFLNTNADGGDGDPVFLSSGSNAFSGSSRLTALDDGQLIFNSNVDMFSSAFAGSGTATGPGAIADAGDVNVFVGDAGLISIAGTLDIAANALGGDNAAGVGGDALGGAARLFVPNGGTVTIGGDFIASADAFGGEGVGGGTAFGGIAGAQVISGLIDIAGNANASALAFGGDSLAGQGGNGGDAFGGNSFLQADGTLIAVATMTIGGDAGVDSSGFGGAGGTGDGDADFPGDGGTGTGGQIGTPNQADPQFGSGAYILSGGDNGNLAIAGATTVLSLGTGGIGAAGGGTEFGGNGGDGIGGTAQAGQAILGGDGSVGAGTASFGTVSLQATGFGGDGGIGGLGDGNGGNGDGFGAFFTARGGTVSATNIDILAAGIAGSGEIAGIGTGGTASLQVALGAALSANEVQIDTIGIGGDTTLDGGIGGLGSAGTGEVLIDAASVQLATLNYFVRGFGGSAAGGAINTDGGAAQGGSINLTISNGGDLTAFIESGVLRNVGGDGTGTGVGGDASGNTTDVTISDSTLNLLDGSRFFDQTEGGAGAVGGAATGGVLDIVFTGSTLTVVPDAQGSADIRIGGRAFGGLGQSQGGAAQGPDVNVLFSQANVTGGGLEVSSTATGGGADLLVGTGGDAISGDIFTVGTLAQIDLTGDALIGSFAIGGDANVGGNATSGFSSLDILETDMTVTGNGGVAVRSTATGGQGDTSAGDAFAGIAQLLMFDATLSPTELFLDARAFAASNLGASGNGGQAIGGTVEAIIEGASVLDTGAFISLANGQSSAGGTAIGGLVGLFIGSVGGTEDVNAGIVEVQANGLGGDGLDQAGGFLIDIESGQFFADTMFVEALGDNPNAQLEQRIVARGGNLLIGSSLFIDTQGDLDLEAVQGSLIGGPTVADPTAAIFITSQGTVSFIGDNDNVISIGGLSLDLAARDIDIEDGSRIGAVSMNFFSLNTDNPAILGGDSGSDAPGPGEGFVLSAAEAARIEVGDFLFDQPALAQAGPNDPSIIIRDVTISGSLDDGTTSVSIGTSGLGGIIRVEGTVAYIDAAPTDSLSFFADERIEIVTPGGIGIVDPAGDPAGTLFLASNNIWAVDPDLLGQLQTDPFFAGRDDLLRVAATGSDDPLGYIRGGTVDLQIGQSLLVRNTGTANEQGGILVGDGGLSIGGGSGSDTPGTGSPLDVFAYGARIDANGNLITGANFYFEVNFNDASTGGVSYTEASEFNDCLITTDECAQSFGLPPGEEEIIREIITRINNPTVIKTVVSSAIPQGTTSNPEGITSVSASNPEVITNVYSSNPPVIGIEESNDEFGLDFPGLIEAPELQDEAGLEDPVASGGDSSLYGRGGPDGTQGGEN